MREKFAQGATSSAGAQTKSCSEAVKKTVNTKEPSHQEAAVDENTSQEPQETVKTANEKVASKRPRAPKAVGPKKKSKVVEGSDEEASGKVFVPEWEVFEGDTLLSSPVEGRKVDLVELLKGICLPADKKKLSLHKTSDGMRAVAQLLAKVFL